MNLDRIQASFKETVTDSIRLYPEGANRYRIFTPFHFDDGDHFVITLLKGDDGNWIITDEGHTYMHMSYEMDLSTLEQGTGNAIIESALEKHGMKEREGKIFARIDDSANAGNQLQNFIQCLTSITAVACPSRQLGGDGDYVL